MTPENTATESTTPAEPKKEKKGPGKKQLTIDRAVLAQERTLLAWVRTGASFLTFGFAIYKLLDARMKEEGAHPLLEIITPKEIGITMFVTGLVGLLLATIRHINSMALLHKYSEKRYFTVSLLQAYVVMALIVLLLIGAATSPS